jgi:diguanylate cyclase (GGDEF)-like protein
MPSRRAGRDGRSRASSDDAQRLDVVAAARRGNSAVRYRALADIARVPAAVGSVSLAQRLARAARLALEGSSISLSVWEPENGRVRCLVNEGLLGPGELTDPVDEYYTLADYPNLDLLLECQLGWVTTLGVGGQTEPSIRLLKALGKNSGISVPIPGPGRVWGELYVTRAGDEPAFTEDDLELAVAVGAQVGAALVTAEYLAEVERLTHIDPLTGLANRKALDERLDQVVAEHRATKRSASLILVDVDDLRELNATNGRAAGDDVIRAMGVLLSSAAARLPGSLAARYDGDEFAIVTSGVAADEVIAVAAWMARRARRSLPLGVSCGVVSTEDDVGPVVAPERMVRLVEAALGRARRGRTQVPVVAGRTLPESTITHDPEDDDNEGRDSERRSADGLVRLLRIGMDRIEATKTDVGSRLVAAAEVVTSHVDGLGWWVSDVDTQRTTIHTVEFALHRSKPDMTGESAPSTYVGEQFPYTNYPAVHGVLAGGWLITEADDPACDPAERALLDGMGAVSLVCAGGPGPDGRPRLVEIFGDELSRSFVDVGPILRALVATALNAGAPTRETPTT